MPTKEYQVHVNAKSISGWMSVDEKTYKEITTYKRWRYVGHQWNYEND